MTAETLSPEVRDLIMELLAMEGRRASNRGDCSCINWSRGGEQAYETHTCPHQRARDLLGTEIGAVSIYPVFRDEVIEDD